MAVGGSTLSTVANTLLKNYPQEVVYETILPKIPLLGLIKKAPNQGGGDTIDITVQYGNPQGVSNDFAEAQDNTSTVNTARFQVKAGDIYAHGEVGGKALRRTKSRAQATLSDLDRGQKSLMKSLEMYTKFFLINNGGGALAQVESISTNTITLTKRTDSIWFAPDQKLNLSLTDGTSGAIRTGSITIASVERRNSSGKCVLTFTGNVTAGIAAAAAGDFIFIKGGHNGSNGGINPVGMLGWLTTPASNDNFFGFNRFVEKQKLAGHFYSEPGGSIADKLKRGLAEFALDGTTPDTVFVNPLNYDDLDTLLGDKKVIVQKGSDIAEIGYEAIQIRTGYGLVDIVPDASVPFNLALALTLETWTYAHVGDNLFMYLKEDGNLLRAVANRDAYQWRAGAFPALYCEDPGQNGRIDLAA